MKKCFSISILSESWINDIDCYWKLLSIRSFFINDIIAEAAKSFVPSFKAQQDSFVKRPSDAGLVLVLMLLCFYIYWKSFKYGNTVIIEYLNRIPNPEFLTEANVPFQACLASCFKICSAILVLKQSLRIRSP